MRVLVILLLITLIHLDADDDEISVPTMKWLKFTERVRKINNYKQIYIYIYRMRVRQASRHNKKVIRKQWINSQLTIHLSISLSFSLSVFNFEIFIKSNSFFISFNFYFSMCQMMYWLTKKKKEKKKFVKFFFSAWYDMFI